MTSTTVDRYVSFFEHLTPENLHELEQLCAADVHFQDPFNDGHGIEYMVRVFERMFTDTVDPSFYIIDSATSGRTGLTYIRWRFTAKTKRHNPLTIEGVSEVRLSTEGRVAEHIDHWDAASQVYEKVPLISFLLRRLRRKLAA